MREEDKIMAGVLFAPANLELARIKRRTHDLNMEYNAAYEGETEKRSAIIRRIVGSIGERFFLQGPIYFHYGIHTSIGDDFFANFHLTVQDDAKVYIGDRCNFGPNVTIVTPLHPMLPDERRTLYDREGKESRLCYARPVSVGNDCWLGANVVVCPGVTIGDGCVIGAGSVVTRDVPPMSFAAGNPCRVIRTLTAADSLIHHPEILSEYRVRKD